MVGTQWASRALNNLRANSLCLILDKAFADISFFKAFAPSLTLVDAVGLR